MSNDQRPAPYQYFSHLLDHLGGNQEVLFNGNLVYPRQIEWHLPADHKKACNLHCPHCAGKFADQQLADWEEEGALLIDNLKGLVPFHIFAGLFSEPTMNHHLLRMVRLTKKHGSNFGIHTNGVLLKSLDEKLEWLSELNKITNDPKDYISISLDASSPQIWGRVKGTKEISQYEDVWDAIRKMTEIRKNRGQGHSIRVCFLIPTDYENEESLLGVIQKAKEAGVDSLRFSIPFAHYNTAFDKVRKFRQTKELILNDQFSELLKPHMSQSTSEKPYVFYVEPDDADISKFDFPHCASGYFQIAVGADGYFYKCPTTASSKSSHCRLGKVTSNLEEFNRILLANYDLNWDCGSQCFSKGLRCNRMGLEVNRGYNAFEKILQR